MNLFGWWRKRRLNPPGKINMPSRERMSNHSADKVKESEQKLKDAISTKKEVSQLIKVNDRFAESLMRSMRRTDG